MGSFKLNRNEYKLIKKNDNNKRKIAVMNHFPKEDNSLNFFNVLQAIVITRREVLSQTAWCMRMPAATDTLKESTMPFIGILQCKSDNSRASSLIPLQERLATKFRKLCVYLASVLI